MKLPNAERAFIDVAKLRDYSLNPEHPKGKHKARVFLKTLGLSQNDADQLRQIILDSVLTAEAIKGDSTEYGRRFVVDFLVSGFKESVLVRSAWIIRTEENFPRLTTCFVL